MLYQGIHERLYSSTEVAERKKRKQFNGKQTGKMRMRSHIQERMKICDIYQTKELIYMRITSVSIGQGML